MDARTWPRMLRARARVPVSMETTLANLLRSRLEPLVERLGFLEIPLDLRHVAKRLELLQLFGVAVEFLLEALATHLWKNDWFSHSG